MSQQYWKDFDNFEHQHLAFSHIINNEKLAKETTDYLKSKEALTLNYVKDEEYFNQCYDFYDTVIEKETILVD